LERKKIELEPGSLYGDGDRYDKIFEGPNDLPFYLEQLKKYGSPVLELACGTGRLALALRKHGAEITGLDLSAPMLQAARKKSSESGLTVEYVLADARSFSLQRRFSLIFIANNSFLHLETRQDIENCLRCVREHLEPDGRFIVDIFTPSIEALARDASKRYSLFEYDRGSALGPVAVSEHSYYDPATQVRHVTWHLDRGGNHQEIKFSLRMLFPQEIDALLTYNGFTIEHKYGNFGETPFGPASPHQLIVCRINPADERA
jgi:SAM-dependent methyltransferase